MIFWSKKMKKQIKLTGPFGQGKNKLYQLFCFGALFSGIVSVGAIAAVDQQPYEKLTKQLDIMDDIFTSSLQSQQDKSLNNTKVDSLYLAGQGAVFTIRSSYRTTWDSNGFNFFYPDVAVPVAPEVPIAPIADGASFEFFDQTPELIEQLELAYEQQREHNRQFRDQQRELAYELRDIERESRDLAYQLRNVSNEQKKELIEDKKLLSKKRDKLEKMRIALTEQSQAMKKKQQIEQETKIAERNEYYHKLTSSLVETLCTYGNSLKALPIDEHISLVLKSAGDRVDKTYQDRILVITKRDLNACVVDKMSAEKLLTSTTSYQF